MIRSRVFLKLVLVICLTITGCGDSGLGKGEAKTIIDLCIKDDFFFPVPKELKFTFDAPKLYKQVLAAKKLGLVSATQTGSDFGVLGGGSTIEKPAMGSKFSVSLTDSGKKAPSLRSADGGITWFIVGSRSVDEIVEIKKEQDGTFTVSASGKEALNALGKQANPIVKEIFGVELYGSSRIRYKAQIAYDSFLKKYILKSLQQSPWENENWTTMTWAEETKDGLVVVQK